MKYVHIICVPLLVSVCIGTMALVLTNEVVCGCCESVNTSILYIVKDHALLLLMDDITGITRLFDSLD